MEFTLCVLLITLCAGINSNDEITVSGFGAGGFFAQQMAIAFSETIQGAGIFNAGPYHCASGDLIDIWD